MKKLLLLALAIVMACTALVGCDKAIGEELEEYLNTFKFPEVRKEVELDLYIITDAATLENGAPATKTVNQAINKYTETEYMTKLNIHYITEVEYKQSVLNAVKETDADKKADIILVNSKELYDELMAGGYLAPLDSYLDATKIKAHELINKRIPEIKADIPSSLFEATAAAADANGNTQFVIPNNRVIGNYKYLVISRQQFFANGYSENVFANPEFDAAAFYTELSNASIECELVENGYYSDKEEYEKNGNICYVYGKPTVTKEYAFESAFAVVNQEAKDDHLEERSMEIIYAINTVPELRNLLQYGDYLTHYTVEIDASGDRKIVPNTTGEIYRMNLDYTGNIFTADYCGEAWNAKMHRDAEQHNKDAQYIAPAPAA